MRRSYSIALSCLLLVFTTGVQFLPLLINYWHISAPTSSALNRQSCAIATADVISAQVDPSQELTGCCAPTTGKTPCCCSPAAKKEDHDSSCGIKQKESSVDGATTADSPDTTSQSVRVPTRKLTAKSAVSDKQFRRLNPCGSPGGAFKTTYEWLTNSSSHRKLIEWAAPPTNYCHFILFSHTTPIAQLVPAMADGYYPPVYLRYCNFRC